MPADQERNSRSATRCWNIGRLCCSASATRTIVEFSAKNTIAATATAGSSDASSPSPCDRPVPPIASSATPASTHEIVSWAMLKTMRSAGRRRIRSAVSEASACTTAISGAPKTSRMAKPNGVEKVSSPIWPCTWIG